jgi:tetratricopeptide (TPR) repeat protein
MDDHDRQLLLLGREHFERGEYDKANELLQQVVAKTDRFADVHHMLGIISHSAGDFGSAETHFEKAIAINPNYTEAQLNLVVTYNELGKYDAARLLYSSVRERTRSLTMDPLVKGRISNLHVQIAQAYLDASMLLEAVDELEKAVRLSPDYADLRVRLGLLYRDAGELGRARSELETARTLNPKYTSARLALGTLLLGAGEHEAARREFDAVLAIETNHPMALTYLKLIQSSVRSSPPPSSAPASA